ncbi:MAG: 1,2-phenylacetyl-CoA epoxidase subunit PaaD [Chitinophagales bacterium]|nr:phenylacetate-CoA oxygenase subunit PaaJ [Bacteroidota bacterium]MCB9042936.1 phenylacetate-CoA oxygenase subunit PaaJ [Chitinophagales bacterium]
MKNSLIPKDIEHILQEIPDPEIPVINIVELGILREVKMIENQWQIIITPTYSGCPAMNMIAADIAKKMREKDIQNFEIITQLSPPWTTDWITAQAMTKLNAYGIAPPSRSKNIQCPLCGSKTVSLVSEFGSTPCKSLYKCDSCKEPFDYFKCH